MPIPEVGDAPFGVLTTIEEAGGWAESRLHNAFVLDDHTSTAVVDGPFDTAGDEVPSVHVRLPLPSEPSRVRI